MQPTTLDAVCDMRHRHDSAVCVVAHAHRGVQHSLDIHQCLDGVPTDEEPVIDPLTGKIVPDCFIKVHRFLRASKQNREWAAYLAHKGREDWPYRCMPLSTVMSYLRWRGPALR